MTADKVADEILKQELMNGFDMLLLILLFSYETGVHLSRSLWLVVAGGVLIISVFPDGNKSDSD
jgi:hypothetical protein